MLIAASPGGGAADIGWPETWAEVKGVTTDKKTVYFSASGLGEEFNGGNVLCFEAFG